jgi:hypothetical protein
MAPDALASNNGILPQSNAAEVRADVEVLGVRRVDEFAAMLFG